MAPDRHHDKLSFKPLLLSVLLQAPQMLFDGCCARCTNEEPEEPEEQPNHRALNENVESLGAIFYMFVALVFSSAVTTASQPRWITEDPCMPVLVL